MNHCSHAEREDSFEKINASASQSNYLTLGDGYGMKYENRDAI